MTSRFAFQACSLLFIAECEAHPVPHTLEQQLKRYARRHMCRVMPPARDELASSLPHFLYEELCREAFTPVTSKHTLFYGLCCKYSAFQRELCVRGLLEWSIMPQETLFLPGAPCISMLFTVRGSITYSKSSLPPVTGSLLLSHTTWTAASVLPASSSQSTGVSTLSEGDWLCEHCLWTPWHYMGQGRADFGADMLCLNRDKVLELAQARLV